MHNASPLHVIQRKLSRNTFSVWDLVCSNKSRREPNPDSPRLRGRRDTASGAVEELASLHHDPRGSGKTHHSPNFDHLKTFMEAKTPLGKTFSQQEVRASFWPWETNLSKPLPGYIGSVDQTLRVVVSHYYFYWAESHSPTVGLIVLHVVFSRKRFVNEDGRLHYVYICHSFSINRKHFTVDSQT